MAKKRKQIKLEPTRGGAQQYERSEGDFERHSDRLFKKFLKDSPRASDPDLKEKVNMLKAGKYANRNYDDEALFEKQQMGFAKELAKERRKRPVKKAKGGMVKKGYKNGGSVMAGRGVRDTKMV
jgi:hypothetical protein